MIFEHEWRGPRTLWHSMHPRSCQATQRHQDTTWLFVFALALIIPLAFLGQATGAEKPLTNDDVTKLVKAGLSDAAVIATIQRSQKQFDLSADALVRLRQAGVSNAVIEAMLQPGQTTQPEQAPTPASPASPRSADLYPTAYGYYVVDGGALRTLNAAAVTTVIGLAPGGRLSGNPGYAVDGFSGEPPVSISTPTPVFIVYQQSVDINAHRFSPLELTASMQANQFNINQTAPQFFANVYGGMTPYDTVPINLWQAKGPGQLRIEPVEGRPGMFRLSTTAALAPGRYTIWFGTMLHPVGTVFTAPPSREGGAFYFEIREEAVARSPSSANRRLAIVEIDSLTKGVPDNFEFSAIGYEVEVSYDVAWAGLMRYLSGRRIRTSDRDRGVVVTEQDRIQDIQLQDYVVVEQMGENRTKFMVKAFCYKDSWFGWRKLSKADCGEKEAMNIFKAMRGR